MTTIKEFEDLHNTIENLRSMHEIQTPLTIVDGEDGHLVIGFDYKDTRITVNANENCEPMFIVYAEDVDSPGDNETRCSTVEDVNGTIEAFIELFS